MTLTLRRTTTSSRAKLVLKILSTYRSRNSLSFSSHCPNIFDNFTPSFDSHALLAASLKATDRIFINLPIYGSRGLSATTILSLVASKESAKDALFDSFALFSSLSSPSFFSSPISFSLASNSSSLRAYSSPSSPPSPPSALPAFILSSLYTSSCSIFASRVSDEGGGLISRASSPLSSPSLPSSSSSP